jgi:hypothetical protein
MSSLFVTAPCRLENGYAPDLVSWSNADLIAAVSANPLDETIAEHDLNEIVFINSEV